MGRGRRDAERNGELYLQLEKNPDRCGGACRGWLEWCRAVSCRVWLGERVANETPWRVMMDVDRVVLLVHGPA